MTACFLIINRARKFFKKCIFKKVETDLTIPPYNNCIDCYEKPPVNAKRGQMYYNRKEDKIYVFDLENNKYIWREFE